MRIRTLTTDYMESHCYIVIEGQHAFIIDPGKAELVRQALQEESVAVDFGILTHEHCDHIYGCTGIRNEFHCKMVSSRVCNEKMKDSRKNFSQYFDAFIEIQTKLPVEQQKSIEPFTTYADFVFDGETAFEWMGHRLYLRETPGHSPGSICIQIDDGVLFSGDTLMKDVSTGTHFLGGSRKKLQEITIPWLKGLPGNLTVYAGHGDSFKLGDRLLNQII